MLYPLGLNNRRKQLLNGLANCLYMVRLQPQLLNGLANYLYMVRLQPYDFNENSLKATMQEFLLVYERLWEFWLVSPHRKKN